MGPVTHGIFYPNPPLMISPLGDNTMQRSCRSLHHRRGFTLIEMLAVLGIVAVVVAVAAPAVLGVINSTRITQAGDEFMGLISQAQQTALAESRPVEVRLYRMSDSSLAGDDSAGQYRGLMFVRYYQAGEPDPRTATGAPLGQPLAIADFGGIHRLPSGVVMASSENLSSLMSLPESRPTGGNADLVAKQNGEYAEVRLPDALSYRSFLCLPEGTDLNTAVPWFVTLLMSNEANAEAAKLKNFYTIQIEPATGRIMSYRP
jgi:uncharacterized protein (TIGR02596 family)